MNGIRNCEDCERERDRQKTDSWALSVLCGIVSGLVGCGFGLLIYYRVFM